MRTVFISAFISLMGISTNGPLAQSYCMSVCLIGELDELGTLWYLRHGSWYLRYLVRHKHF
jgi:hypothetical protein